MSIDPSTTSLGFCVYSDKTPINDGFFEPDKTSPRHCLESIEGLLNTIERDLGPLDAVASEVGWNKGFAFNPYMLVLSLIPEQVKNWATSRGKLYVGYAAKRIKSEFKVGPGDRLRGKKIIFGQVEHLMSDSAKALPQSHRFDIADAHAVAWVARKYQFKPAPKR